MPVSCSALDCKNRFMKGSGITFHRFPISRPDLMAKWLKAVARENWMPSPKATLCSDHFTKDCFEERNDRRHLQFSSVPTIFPPPKNKTTGSRRPHKAKACGHQKVTSEIQLLLLPWQAGSVDEALSQPTESIKITDVQSTLTAETLNTGRLAELAAAAAVLNLAEFSQVLAVPLKAEAESSEVLTVLNCSAETQTCATDAQIESVSSGLITAHSEEQSQNSEEQSQDSAVALCSDALHCTANVLELCSDSFHWTANVLPRPEVLSDAATALMGSMDVSAMAASVLPCLFTTSADRTSDRATISEGTTWISTEVLIPETETHLSTPVLASEELQCSSEMVLSYYDDQDLSRMPFRQDHSYFMNPCPDTIRKTLEKKLAWERKKNADHRQKFRVLQQKLKRKEQKIYSLCKIIKLLRERKTDDLCNSNI